MYSQAFCRHPGNNPMEAIFTELAVHYPGDPRSLPAGEQKHKRKEKKHLSSTPDQTFQEHPTAT
jgi:hypothetical protein